MHGAGVRTYLGALVVLLAAGLVLSAGSGTVVHPPRTAGAAPSTVGKGPALSVSPSGRVAVAPAYAPPAGVTEVGPVPANRSLTVEVGLAPRDPSGLAAFVNATAVPGTPAYRQFLSASAADARFGASPGAVGSAEGYFEGFGLAADAHPDGLLLSVTGPGPAVARAFGTTLDLYRDGSGATFVAHATAASLPPVAPWTGVLGLDTNVAFVPDVRPSEPAGVADPASSCGASPVGLSACDVATAYNFTWLQPGGANGTNETIAVVDAYSSAEPQPQLMSDFALFSSTEGLPGALNFEYPVPTTANLNASGTNPLWNYEDALDPEWAHAAAPGASIDFVASPNAGPDLYFAIDWIVAGHEADVISMSWGEPEVGIFNAASTACSSACNASSDGSIAILEPILELAAAEGIGAFAASGDCGAADGTSGVAVNFPASDPYVTGVGATNLSTGPGEAWTSETAWSGNSSGARSPGCQNHGGSGGGYSVLPRPWWQTGEGTVASKGRGVPDVAMVGGSGSPVVVYVGGGEVPLSGTSVGTPIWAGIAADADQAHGSDLGWLNPSLYGILSSPSYPKLFHDVQSGSNGYRAHAGWDPVTGVGTPIVGALLANLSRGAATASTLTTYVYASPRFGPAPLTVRFAVDAHGGSGTYALEGVEFDDGNSSAVAAGTVAHTFGSPGVYAVQSYVADSSGNLSASPPVVVVVGGGTSLAVGLNASLPTPAVNANDTFTATVAGSGPFLYDFWFGDGTFTDNLSAGTVVHPYRTAGSFCAEVVVRTTGSRPDGGASLRLPVAVGGATSPSCGNPAAPLALVANATEGIRDAPADFPSLFASAGGASAPDGLASQVGLVSLSPTDAYVAACACAILRSPGVYTLEEWENDTVGGEASATANVTVTPALNVTFHASTLAGPVPLVVSFSANVSGGYDPAASATQWRFGNNLHATGATANTTYATPGEYVAVASLSDRGYGNGSEAFVIDAEAAGPPAVGLTATVTPAVNVSSGATVHWSATPVGPPSATAGDIIAWSLGNGGSAYGPTANETYFASTDLLASNQLVASVTLETSHLVPVVSPVSVTLTGFFATQASGFVPAVDALQLTEEVYPSAGAVPLVVTATASATGPGGAAVAWLFGDGGSGGGKNVSHVYYGAGDYTVQAEAYDGPGDLAFRLTGVAANAALTLGGCGARTRQGTAPYTVVLAPTASGGAGAPYTYHWTLPNGTASTATDLTLTFASAGTYTVNLVVSDSSQAMYGCAWSIVVSALPPISFLDVVAAGVGAGVALAVVFLWATRPPRPR